MLGKTPKRAFDAFLDRFRLAVQCVADSEAFGSGYGQGHPSSIILTPRSQRAGDPDSLRTRDGRRDLMLDVTFRYAIATVTHLDGQSFSAVRTSYHSYGVLDGEEREILAYQWHPDGPSPVRFPHLHVTAAPAILLAERAAPRSEPRSVALGRMHLRTGPVILEDVVELLITEFDVAPRRRDRSDVLTENRSLRQDERHD